MDEIQRTIIKRDKRNAITRLFRGDDKEAIDTWRLNFNGILHVFNVRSVTSGWPLLTSRLKTELAISKQLTISDTRRGVATTHTTVSDVHHDTPDADNIVSDVHRDVSYPIIPNVRSGIINTRTTAPDTRRDKLKSREDMGGRNQAVSITRTLTLTE